jgi:hypothetical protein
MFQLRRDHALFLLQSNKLLALLQSIAALSPQHQKLVEEIVLLRLSALLEEALEEILCKICCGATYLDGTSPILQARQRSIAGALHAMENHGRQKPRRARWNDGADIRENVRLVVDGSDHIFAVLRSYAGLLTELRYMRNGIAHSSQKARRDFSTVIYKYYGGYPRGVTAGTLLLSPRVGTPPLIQRHVISGRVFISDLVKQ